MATEDETTEEAEESEAGEGEAQYPLAYDVNGNPIDVPLEAVAWRVRRGGGRRGRPRHVFDPETGRQLEVALGATLDSLIDAGCPGDRYLLYPVDAAGRVIPGTVAVTEVPETGDEVDAGVAPSTSEKSALLAVVNNQLATIKEQSQTLCRALEATTNGYGRVRPLELPQQPIFMEAPAPPPESGGGILANIKPEQIGQVMGYVKLIVDMFKGAGAPAPAVGPMEGGG